MIRCGEALEAGERALKMGVESNTQRFSRPWCLGSVALAASDEGRRGAAIEEGFTLLSQGAVSHNHLHFYRAAMEVGLETRDWDLTDRACSGLTNYTGLEPFPWSDYYIARAEILREFYQGNNGDGVVKTLLELKNKGEKLGVRASLSRIEYALGDVAR